jgi:hypothetical protein
VFAEVEALPELSERPEYREVFVRAVVVALACEKLLKKARDQDY